jgi:hypothetical protein
MFACLISHQPAVLFSQNRPVTSNLTTILFSQNKPAPTISHRPNEQAVELYCLIMANSVSQLFWQKMCDLSLVEEKVKSVTLHVNNL